MKGKVVLLGLLFASSLQAATITPKKGIEILFVDGVKVEEKREKITLDAKTTQLMLRYSKQVGNGNTKKIFDSAPFIITINVPDSDLTVNAPKVYSYEKAKREFKTAPEWLITDNKDNEINYRQEKLKPNDGFMPYYDLEVMLEKYNQDKGIIFGFSSALVTASKSTEKGNNSENAKLSNLSQLQSLYLKTNKEERKAFQKWIIDHN